MMLRRIEIQMIAPIVVSLYVVMGSQAHAQITIGNPVAPPPTTPGDGLHVDYYKLTTFPETIAFSENYIANNAPNATFISTGVGYPSNNPGGTVSDSTSLSTYLGPDAATLSNPSVGSNTLDQSIYHYTGYIDITTANLTTTFFLGSDDGSRLSLNGIQVIDNDGDHGYTTQSQIVDFTAPGLYSVDLISFEDGGVTGVLWSSSIGAPSGGSVEIPESILYQSAVPEPSSLTLTGMATAAIGLVCLLRRRGSRSSQDDGVPRRPLANRWGAA
jgi:hypothetical protein